MNLNKCETKSEKLFYYLFRSGRVPNTSPANNLVLGGIQVLGIVHESRLRLDRVLTPWPCTRLDLKISWASISSTYIRSTVMSLALYIRYKASVCHTEYGDQTVCVQPYQKHVRLADNLPGYLTVT